jgi:DNA modification methylase
VDAAGLLVGAEAAAEAARGAEARACSAPTAGAEEVNRLDVLAGASRFCIAHEDALTFLRSLPDASVDSVVTDPPAGIAFMGKDWDDAWKYPISKHGFTDGAERASAPAIGSASRNPNCRTCKRHRRGWKDVPGCQCEKPDFDDRQDHLKARAAFVWFLTEILSECLRVLKPGGHALVWSIPRTSHWTATAIEDAGFEIRDCIHHVFGQGFPKSLNVGKAVSKMRGVDAAKEREIAAYLRGRREALGLTRAHVDEAVFGGTTRYAFVEGRGNEDGDFRVYLPTPEEWSRLKDVLKLDDRFDAYVQAAIPSRAERALVDGGKAELVGTEEGSFGYQQSGERWEKAQRVTRAVTDDAKKWNGWGTQMKPAVETWWLARKPVEAQSVAAQVLATGTGAINIDGARIAGTGPSPAAARRETARSTGAAPVSTRSASEAQADGKMERRGSADVYMEKRPSEDLGRWPANLMLSHAHDCAPGACVPGCPVRALDAHENRTTEIVRRGDSGGASRFFQNFEPDPDVPFFYAGKATDRHHNLPEGVSNHHPTVKGQKLMRYLVRLVTPPGGVVLDPFTGSGSTAVACFHEGFRFLGCERDEGYVEIARARLIPLVLGKP